MALTSFMLVKFSNKKMFCQKNSIHNLSTLYVVRKFTNKKQVDIKEESAIAPPSKREVTMAMQSALLNLEYRNIVQRMLSDPDSVENIIATTPGLDNDPAVLAMLQEPELAAVLSHPQNLESLLELHPSFAQAAVTIATAVNEESAKSGKTSAGGLSYSMDQMSDEDEEMPEPGPSSGTITNDFFQQAMAHAQSASSDGALQQLREMGITDENVARQALAATG